jgi:hypothetical protein
VIVDDNLEITLALFVVGREVIEDNQIEIVDVVRELSLLFPELQNAGVLECARNSADKEGASAAGATVQVERFLNECGEESQLHIVFSFWNVFGNDLKKFGKTLTQIHIFSP